MKQISNIISSVLIVLLMLYFSLAGEHFLTYPNLMSILETMTEFGIIAFGMMLAIMVSGINLTIGSVCGLTSLVVISLYKSGVSIGLSVAIALALSIILGIVTGAFITKLKIAPMLLTLSMSMVYTGISYVISEGNAISGFPVAYWYLGQEKFLGLPAQAWVLAAVTIILTILLRKTAWGLQIYGAGNNPVATEYSGVNSDLIIASAYVLGSFLAGLSGVIMSSRVATARLDLGTSYEVKSIAAVVLGGASMAGGSGSPLGTLLGVAIISILSNGMNHVGTSAYIQQFILGLVLIAVLVFNVNVLPFLHPLVGKWQGKKGKTSLSL